MKQKLIPMSVVHIQDFGVMPDQNVRNNATLEVVHEDSRLIRRIRERERKRLLKKGK